ncbi:MAG: cation diffusion facilitator family transporter [Deltaproteobacteria bacterium]|nr:cation diffusion facilitator family transporter [Deltaproteobacteria bacterium]
MPPMSGHSTKSVIAGLSANVLVTIAKFIGFAVSGSGAMLSEAIHSVADTSNQALLLLGLRSSEREADAAHPYGYGRARFFWGLVSALGIFFVGAGVTTWHGVITLLHPSPSHHTWVTWVVLAISFALEGSAAIFAFRGLQHDARAAGVPVRRYAFEAHDPTANAILMEDGAAVLGILLAAAGIGLEQLTGWPGWDALASITIGTLLGAVAVALVRANRSYLLSKSVDEEVADRVLEVIHATPAIEAVKDLRGVVLTLGNYHIAAEVDFDGAVLADRVLADRDLDALSRELADPEALRAFLREFGESVLTAAGDEVDLLEARIREEVPGVTHIALETDRGED